MALGNRSFPTTQVVILMTHRGKSAKPVFIFLSSIIVLVLAERVAAIESKVMLPNSPVALDAVKAKLDVNKEIQSHFRVCPADIAEKVRPRSIPLSDVDISAEECGNDSELCYKKCLDRRNGSACLALAQLFEARKPTEDPIHAQMLYAQACATGNSSGCTNRASGIRNGQFEGDPMISLAPQVLESCYFRTFQFSCGRGDSWGCAMLGQSYQFGEGVEESENEARRYFQRSCEIDGDDQSCDFAREHIKEFEDDAATSLIKQAITYKSQDAYSKAKVEIDQLNDQVKKFKNLGKYQEAIPLAEKALEIRKKALGPEHLGTAISLNNLAFLYTELGAYAQAEPLYQRALTINEKALGSEHPDTATNLNNLAGLYRAMGAYAKAEPLYQRALAIMEKAQGPEHPDTATSLNNLALLYIDMGTYPKAESLSQRALAINEKTLGPEHPATALSLNNLAILYDVMGAYNKVEPLFQRALAINEKTLGPGHSDTAASLNNLAELYTDMGDNAKAEPLYQRALAIYGKALGPGHPNTAISVNNLAGLYFDLGAYSKAERLFLRALAINEKTLGPGHPDTAASLNNLAELYTDMGDNAKAEPLYQRALAIYEKALGTGHPDMAMSYSNLGVLYWSEEHWPKVVDVWKRSNKIKELNAQNILVLGDEARKKAYMEKLVYDGEVSFSLAAESKLENSHALGLELVLQRKGRVLETITDSIGLLRKHLTPADQTLLDKLADVRSQQAALLYNKNIIIEPSVYQAQVAKLNTQAEDIESKLSARSAEFKNLHQTVTLERVQAALPKGSALVELVVYRPFNPKGVKPQEKWGEPHYMAYVLQPSGEAKGIDLGKAKGLDALIDNWRKALSNPRNHFVGRGVTVASSDNKSSGTANTGQQLYIKLIKPLLPLIGDTKTLFVAPDGDLNLVPLGALPDGTGHYLLETHEINYLTSGRDMLKWSLPANTAKEPVVLANPDFGSISKKVEEPDLLAANDRGRRSGDYTRGTFHFDPLAGTAEEAKELSKLLTDGAILTGAKATETALKAIHSPRILHLATHGFFLPDQPDEKPDTNAGMLSLDGQRPLPPSKNENPLLRSGIALAGANLLQSGTEDGVLTALEASGLDLWGTKLVVLSACETGIGKVSNGEGVYGLRRALVNAGAEAQVMSLWKVDDAATRDLMVDYYKRQLAGAGRADALRQTQLAMLNSKDRNHPYYWAAFIASGDVRPIAQVKP